MKVRVVATTVCAIVAVAAAVGDTGAGVGSGDGRIVFTRYRHAKGTADLFVVGADGSGERRLTRVKAGYVDDRADWSPDGSRIVFTRCPPRGGACGIWTIESAGSHLKRLSPPCPPGAAVPKCVEDGDAVYSPNGRRIAFFRFTGTTAALMIADAQLKHARPVALGHEPGWSPDGERLAFERFNDPGTGLKPTGARAIFRVDTDGKPLRRLQPWSVVAREGKSLKRITSWKPPAGDYPEWSPDGRRILFRTMPGSEDFEHSRGNLYTVSPNGTDVRQLTRFSKKVHILQNGSFSADGGSIVFATNGGASGAPDGAADLFVIGADGTNLHRLMRTTALEISPDWGR